jgi:hypothetical protein
MLVNLLQMVSINVPNELEFLSPVVLSSKICLGVRPEPTRVGTFQALHLMVGSWPYPQALD